MKAQPRFLHTAEDGSPLLTVSTSSGRRTWVFRIGSKGPECTTEPTREDGTPVRTPTWVKQSADHWWCTMVRLATEMASDQNAIEALRNQLDHAIDQATQAMLYEVPGARERAIRQVRDANRIATAPAAPESLAETLDSFSARLTWQIHRFAPMKSLRHDGPTPETVAKQKPMPIDEMYIACGLTAEQRHTADLILRIYHELTAPIDAKAANLEPSGGGSSARTYAQPIERLGQVLADEYVTHFRPWSLALSKRPAYPGSRVTHFQVIMAMLLDGTHWSLVEKQCRLPLDRAKRLLTTGIGLYRCQTFHPDEGITDHG